MTPKCPVCSGKLISGRCWSCGWTMDDFVNFRTIAVPAETDLNEWRKFQEVRKQKIARESAPKIEEKKKQTRNNGEEYCISYKNPGQNKPVEGAFWRAEEKKNQISDNDGEYHISRKTSEQKNSAEGTFWKTDVRKSQSDDNDGEYRISYSTTGGSDIKVDEQQTTEYTEDTNHSYSKRGEYDPDRYKDMFDTIIRKYDVPSSSPKQHTFESETKQQSKETVWQGENTGNGTDAKKPNEKNYVVRLLISELVLLVLCMIYGKNMWQDVGVAVYTAAIAAIFLVFLSFYYFVKIVGKWEIPVVVKILIDIVGYNLCTLPVVIFTT